MKPRTPPLRINFAPRSLARALWQTSARSWCVAALILAFAVSAGVMSWRLHRNNQSRQVALAGLQQQLRARDAQQAPPPALVIAELQANAVNVAIVQLNLPWRDLFDAIEAATPPAIALLSLEPDAKHQAIKGLAEAKNTDGMLAYVEELKQQTLFQSVVLLRQEINEQDSNKPVRFQFQAQWGGAQ